MAHGDRRSQRRAAKRFHRRAEDADVFQLPASEVVWSPNALVVRTSVDPLSLATSVRNAIWAVDKDQPVANIDSMEHIVAGAVARQRFSMLLLAIFAGLALVLAAVGIYGVMSYSVAQQTREIGIRIALGAQRGDVLKMTVKQGIEARRCSGCGYRPDRVHSCSPE